MNMLDEKLPFWRQSTNLAGKNGELHCIILQVKALCMYNYISKTKITNSPHFILKNKFVMKVWRWQWKKIQKKHLDKKNWGITLL
jgi:membrane-anchored glycerophosphoryl diester phosphodiesterase (GDPDase)